MMFSLLPGYGEQQNRSLGQIISDLTNKSLRRRERTSERNGVLLLDVGLHLAPPVTLEIVNELRDELL